jgi:hypothetical protein
MEEFILSETRAIFNKAIKRFAKENKKDQNRCVFSFEVDP